MFTLQSFVSQAKPVQSINKIIIFGTSASIKGLPELITDLSHIKCETFHINSLIHNGFGISAKSSIPQTNIVSLATALPNTSTSRFNLRKREFALSNTQQFINQFIIALALAGLIIGSLLAMALWQTSKLKREVYQSEQEVIGALKEKIKKIPEDANGLDDTIDAAKAEVNREEKMWSAFSSAAHPHFLEYLLELTNKIDKASLGFELEKLTITADTIVMKAQVRGFDELATLQRDLAESKLFVFDPKERVHDPKFTMTIRLAKKIARREQA